MNKIKRLLNRFLADRKDKKQLRQLYNMPDNMIKDIGTNRSDVEYLLTKPWWKYTD